MSHHKSLPLYTTLKSIEPWNKTREGIHYDYALWREILPSPYSPAPFLDSKVSLWQGDITQLAIDAIVNSTDPYFSGGGGVDLAVHSGAGLALRQECAAFHGCPTGQTRISSGHLLPAKYILHTVAPSSVVTGMLHSCYESCFELVLKHGIKSVAFCCIATGRLGYSNDGAAEIALTVTRNWLEKYHDQIERVIFCVYEDDDYYIYEKKLCKYFPPVATSRDAGMTSPMRPHITLATSTTGKDMQHLDRKDTSPSPHTGKLEIQVYYGTIPVSTDFVDCYKGQCRILSYFPLFSHPNEHTIELPKFHSHSKSKDIFRAVGNGIILEVFDGDVYVTPLCGTDVYCSNSASPKQDAMQVSNGERTKVFDYNKVFQPTLKLYADSLQDQSPSPSFFLGLGQTWGQGHNVTDNLISIKATHCKAKLDIDTIEVNINHQATITEIETAMSKDEKISRKLAHGILIGPTGAGKSSLMDRLLGRKRRKGFSSSTGVSESVVMIDVDLANPSEFKSVTVMESDAWREVEFDTSLARQMEEGIALLPKDDEIQPLKEPFSPPNVAHKPSVHLESSSATQATSTDLISVVKTRSIAVIVSASVSSVREAISHIVKKCGGTRWFKRFLKKSFSIYLRDTGGQVEFQEMVPLLISGPSIFFFVFRLDLDFKKKFRVEYRKSEGESLNSYTSSITTEEAFLQSLASVDSMDISDEVHGVNTHKPLVFVIGTHKDKLGSLAAEKIAELNEHLKSLIKAHHFEHLVQSADREKGHIMFTVDNTSEDDTDFQLIQSKVNSLVRGRKEFTIEYPLRYLLFCLELQNVKATILTLDECKDVAAKFGIKEDQLLHLLQFLHLRIGVIRYFDKDGVRHIVIKEPQVLFNAVTNLIVTTFSSEAITDEEASNFQKKGILTATVLDNISALCDISPEVFLELLVHLRIAAPFVTPGDQDKEKNFFLPSVLNHVPESTGDLKEPTTDILPLAVQFKCQHCPKGLFGVLVTHLMMLNDGATTTFTLMPDRIFKNQVSFIVCSRDSVHDQMALKVYTSHLEMKFFPGLSEDREVSIAEVCSNVRQIVETAIHQSLRDLHYSERRAKPEMCFRCSDCNNFHAAKKCKIYCPVENVTRCLPGGGKCWCYEGDGNLDGNRNTVSEVCQSAHRNGVQRTDLEPRDVNPYIKMLSTPQLYDLGGELGLNITELRRVSGQELPGELAERWLRGDDAVHKTSGTPSWGSLIKALRSQVVGATGVADRIEREKLT